MSKNKTITVVLPESLVDKVDNKANKEMRSRSAQIKFMLEALLKGEK